MFAPFAGIAPDVVIRPEPPCAPVGLGQVCGRPAPGAAIALVAAERADQLVAALVENSGSRFARRCSPVPSS